MKRKSRAELIADAASLLGLEMVPHVDAETVGWCVLVGYTVRGAAHLCLSCHPTQPTGMAPVYRQQLAATERCRLCGRRLDERD